MPLQEKLAELLLLPEDGAGAPTLATLERRLTDGYAGALALEAERWRIERRLAEIARAGDDARNAEEVAALTERLADVEDELARLRAVLRSLQDRRRNRLAKPAA